MKFLSFDFGDGTTSAALCEGGEPVVQNILRGMDEIPSVLNYCVGDDGRTRAVIGGNAVDMGDTEAGLRMNWKSRPTQMEQTPGYPDKAKINDTKIFIKTVYSEFLANNAGAVDKDTRIVIGTPSAWTDKDRAQYKKYAEEAGLNNVSVLSESQAAYLFAQRFLKDSAGNTLPSSIIRDGLLIVDVGSSTTDFTFARGMHSENYGVALGAKYVDENLFKWGISRSSADAGILEKLDNDECREIRLRLVFKCRERKEKYFSKCHPGECTWRVPERVEEWVGDDEVSFRLGDLENGLTMSEALFKRILDDGCEDRYLVAIKNSQTGTVESDSWRGHFRKGLKYVAEKLVGSGREKVSIVLTGGASRMYFIDEDIRKVFGPRVSIFAGMDKDRSFSVVKGLAWAGYAIEEIDDAINKLPEQVRALREKVMAMVCKKIVEKMSYLVLGEVQRGLKTAMGKHLPEVRTRAKIRSYMQKLASESIEKWSRSMRSDISDVYTSILKCEDVVKFTSEIVKKFGRVDVPFETPSFGVGLRVFQGVQVQAVDLYTLWDDIRKIWTSQEKLDTEFLDDDKLDSILEVLDMDFQRSKWDELRCSIQNVLQTGSAYLTYVTDLILSGVLKAKQLELRALKGVFEGDA